MSAPRAGDFHWYCDDLNAVARQGWRASFRIARHASGKSRSEKRAAPPTEPRVVGHGLKRDSQRLGRYLASVNRQIQETLIRHKPQGTVLLFQDHRDFRKAKGERETESGAGIPLRPVTLHARSHRMNRAGPPRPIIWRGADNTGEATQIRGRLDRARQLIMVARLDEVDPNAAYHIDEPMFFRDATEPRSCENVLQRFGLSDAKGIPQHRLDQIEHPQRHPSINVDPIAQVLAKFGMKDCQTFRLVCQVRTRAAVDQPSAA